MGSACSVRKRGKRASRTADSADSEGVRWPYLSERLEQHLGGINCLSLSEDHSLLVSGSEDGRVLMWSSQSTPVELLGTLSGHEGYVTHCTVHGNFVLTGSADGTLRKWSIVDAKCVHVFVGHGARVNRVLCTGDLVLSTSHDKTARAWRFNADLDEQTSGSENVRKVWSKFAVETKMRPEDLLALVMQVSKYASGEAAPRIVFEGVDVVARSKGACPKYSVKLVADYLSVNCLCVGVPADKEGGFCMFSTGVFGAKASEAVATAFKRHDGVSLRKVKISAIKLCKKYTLEKHAVVAVNEFKAGGIEEVCRFSFFSLQEMEEQRLLRQVASSGRSSRHSSATKKRSDSQASTVKKDLEGDDTSTSSGFSEGADSRSRTHRVDDRITVFRGHTKSVFPVIFVPTDGLSDADAEDIVVTGSHDCTARTWGLFSGDCLKILRGHTAPINAMEVDAEGVYMFTGGADGVIRSWHVRSGECQHVLTGHQGPIVCLLAHSKMLYSGSSDNTARAWVMEFGECTRVYRGHQHTVDCLCYHDRMLYTGSGDKVARMFEAKSGTLKRSFRGHEHGVVCIEVVKGKLFTGSYDGSLFVWDTTGVVDETVFGDEVIQEEDDNELPDDSEEVKMAVNFLEPFIHEG
nr:WD repeat-containing protein 86-like [Dermacentor andersoni]